MILFAGGREHLEQAKEYIARYELTIQQVRLVQGYDYVHVVTRNGKPLWSTPCPSTSSNQESLKKHQD